MEPHFSHFLQKQKRMFQLIQARGLTPEQEQQQLRFFRGRNPLPKYEIAPFLTPAETSILVLLAIGATPRQICQSEGITPACLHAHCYHIRQKTGLESLQDPMEAQMYLEAIHHQGVKGPSTAQLQVLRLVAEGHSYDRIAQELGIQRQTAETHAWRGCQRIGISARGEKRRQLIRDYLLTLPSSSPTL